MIHSTLLAHAGARARRVTFVALASIVAMTMVTACATPRGDGASDSTGAGGTSSARPGAAAGDVAPSGSAPDNTGGASDARQHVALELDRTRYAAGATVNLRIVNRDDVGYGFSACQRAIEHRRGGTWETVPEEGRMCTMQLQLLGARHTAMATTELPTPLAAGEYRIAITFSREEGPVPPGREPTAAPAPVRATSATFRVE